MIAMDSSQEVSKKKILIIEDNPDMVEILRASLSTSGADVVTAENGEEGLRQLYRHRPDLVLLDIAMPVMDGWETCRRIRKVSSVPIIMVSALAEERDVVTGLELGAIDYVTKPFSTRILRARVKAALRQAETTAVPDRSFCYADDYLSVDLVRREVCVANTAVHLSKTEFALLECLVLHYDRALPSQEIIDHVWGDKYYDGLKNLYVYISQLRQKLEKIPAKPEYILTEYGVGYRFRRKTMVQNRNENGTAVSI